MKKVVFTEQDKIYMVETYKKTQSLSAIAKEYKTKPHRIKEVILAAGIEIKKHKTGLNETIFDVIDTPDKAYWLGFLNGDGYNNVERGWIRLKLGGIDKDHVYKFCRFMGMDEFCVKYGIHTVTHNTYYYINVCSKHVSKLLESYGIVQAKSGHEHVVKVPDEFVRDYLRGLIDADGCICRRKLDLSGSKENCFFFQTVMNKEFCFPFNGIHEHENTYRINYAKQATVKIAGYLYYEGVNTYLDRKKILADECRAVYRQQLQKSIDD